MRKYVVGLLIGLIGASALLVASFASAGGGPGKGKGKLAARGAMTGYEEVPAVSTTGNGRFEARVNRAGTELAWRLSYRNLEGTVTQAHIHFGQKSVNGGISVWLCGTATNPGPPGTQTCPPPPATITGVARAADVVGPAGQGIAPGEFAELLRAMRVGATYANVHSTTWPGGEIRAQLKGSRGGDD